MHFTRFDKVSHKMKQESVMIWMPTVDWFVTETAHIHNELHDRRPISLTQVVVCSSAAFCRTKYKESMCGITTPPLIKWGVEKLANFLRQIQIHQFCGTKTLCFDSNLTYSHTDFIVSIGWANGFSLARCQALPTEMSVLVFVATKSASPPIKCHITLRYPTVMNIYCDITCGQGTGVTLVLYFVFSYIHNICHNIKQGPTKWLKIQLASFWDETNLKRAYHLRCYNIGDTVAIDAFE